MFTGLQNTHSQDKLLTIQDPDTFLFHFPNLRYANGRRLCYLCFQVERDHCSCDDGDWGVFRNKPAQHAEVRLLKRIQSWELGSELPYEVTCFQSWSPCCNCAKQLARFLEENKHVTLSIFASRLHTMEDYEEGLRILRSAGAHIAIMTSQDFEHCWDTSVDNHGNPFQPWNTLVSQSQKLSEKLKVILKVMDLPPLCLPCPPPKCTLGLHRPL
uniref:CMP/dCMP-type deaminase domain-containing protein n=1 Tax=Suricata suricatta TaxID=37032 RepID=A0A673ULP7_SURSU